MQKRLKAVFTGTVQGVGFRAGAENLARQYPVTGYVRNLVNGKVEVVGEGEEEALRNFISALRDSPLAAYIRNVSTEWVEASGEFSGFKITR